MTSIVDKLNMQKYPKRLILQLPQGVDYFQGIAYDEQVSERQYDLIFAFIMDVEEFQENVRQVVDQALLREQGYLYIAYPKKKNPTFDTYISREDIYNEKHYDSNRYIHKSDLKFSRMVSLDETYTVVGMKRQTKKTPTTSKPSQKIADYEKYVPEIKRSFASNEESLAIYNSLPPGYQKEWARFVYSAKRSETQKNRLQKMEEVLQEGYKSMDLYRRDRQK
ncbi:YdeI/OmpD-associated family protein [Halalkalibacillus halophilus]|uniref:YdeI/OmpD-associated family protein n=1 Tax=Halalkalibacillus halophilus TaxID=392827 RepID=UPI0003F7FE4D|nr:YdeI/OmpD-associated family protein [Halalkalibacillus halophilus]